MFLYHVLPFCLAAFSCFCLCMVLVNRPPEQQDITCLYLVGCLSSDAAAIALFSRSEPMPY